jgi:CBS domain-containing protein/RNA polymerase-binding transcription factor DksA
MSRVRDWMTGEPVRLRDDASALEALDRMVDHGVRHLPVVDARDRVIGIVSIDDLRAAFPFDVSLARPPGSDERTSARDGSVAGTMTWAPRTIRADARLEEAARELSAHRIGCLPVVDEEDRLVGILSETDALRALDALLRGAERSDTGEGQDRLVDALRAERERIADQLAKWQDAERALSADIHDEPRDAVDRAADEREVGTLAPLSERAAARLRAIDAALGRAKHGRFGICERCKERIPATRLRAIPEATLCVRCARASGGVVGA